jgi:hypothetical protein
VKISRSTWSCRDALSNLRSSQYPTIYLHQTPFLNNPIANSACTRKPCLSQPFPKNPPFPPSAMSQAKALHLGTRPAQTVTDEQSPSCAPSVSANAISTHALLQPLLHRAPASRRSSSSNDVGAAPPVVVVVAVVVVLPQLLVVRRPSAPRRPSPCRAIARLARARDGLDRRQRTGRACLPETARASTTLPAPAAMSCATAARGTQACPPCRRRRSCAGRGSCLARAEADGRPAG